MRYLMPAILVCLGACSDDNSSVSNNDVENNSNNVANNTNNLNNDAGCVPDRARYESEIKPILETHCTTCHGDSPTYGAPQALTAYESLTMRTDAFTEASLVASRVALGSMPPVGMPGLPDAAAAALVEWASCGSQEPMPNARMTSSAPVFLAPQDPPTGGTIVDMVANEFEVGPEVKDLYQCFTFQNELDADKFVRRIEVVEDRKEVLHHVVFLRDPEKNAPTQPHNCVGMPAGSDYLYAWAPGTGPIQFPDGGFRIQPGEQFVVQLHYNNGAGLPDVRDSSGIRLYLDEPQGTEYGMIAVGPLAFTVPGKTEKEVTGDCRITGNWRALAGMPHMHEAGKHFRQTIVHADGTESPFVELNNWEFETQLFYGFPTELKTGDTLKTTCTFDNQNIAGITSGPRTQDEMCFNFLYVTPPPPSRYCDTTGDDFVTDINYSAGACLTVPGIAMPELAQGQMILGEAPPLAGGVIAEGNYQLEDVQIWRTSADTPIGAIDMEASKILAKGQFLVQDGEVILDMNILSDTVLVAGQRLTRTSSVSTRIAVDPTVTETLAGDVVCGDGERANLRYETDGATITVGVPGNVYGIDFESRYVFTRL